MVSPTTMRLRKECHARFDEIWHLKKMDRGDAYRRLAILMKIDESDCHFGRMEETQLLRAKTHITALRAAAGLVEWSTEQKELLQVVADLAGESDAEVAAAIRGLCENAKPSD